MNPKILFSLLSCLFIAQFQCKAQCAFSATMQTLHANCQASGSISVLTSGSSGPFAYRLDSNGTTLINYNPANVFTGLYPGTYQVKVKDTAINCETTSTVIVTASPTSLTLQSVLTPTTLCNNATITANVQGGNLPYDYELINTTGFVTSVMDKTEHTHLFNNLSAGEYTIKVTDYCGDIRINAKTIQPLHWVIQYDSTKKIACNQYRLDSILMNPMLPPSTYTVTIKQGGVTLGTSTILPIPFSNPDATIHNVTVEVTYCGVTKSKILQPTYQSSLLGATLSYTSCNNYKADSFIISGNPVLPIQYGISLSTGITYTTSVLPLTFVHSNTISATGTFFIIDACGKIYFAPNNEVLDFTSLIAKSFSTCSTSTIQLNGVGKYIAPLQFSLDGSPYQTLSNQFLNVSDGIHFFSIRDACLDSTIGTITVDHSWQSLGDSDIHCNLGYFRDQITLPLRMKTPFTIERFQNSFANRIDSTYHSAPTLFIAASTPTEYTSKILYVNSLPNNTYYYVLKDACNRSDTVIIPHGPNGMLPYTIQGSYTPLCSNRGNLHAYFNTNGIVSGAVMLRVFDIQNMSLPLFPVVVMSSNTGTYTWLNLDSGIYVIKMFTSNCPLTFADTVQIDSTSIPILQNVVTKYINTNTVLCTMNASSGVPPYKFEVVYTVPAGIVIGLQSDSTFTFTGNYDSVRLRVIDTCGSGTAITNYIQPFQLALPLIQITASATLENSIPKIEWITVDEKNIADFTIERSIDGIHFQKIATYTARGNTVGETRYTVDDNEPLSLNDPMIYYRVIANEISEAKHSSNIVVLKLQIATDNVTIFPLPMTDVLHVRYVSSKTQKVKCTLYDCTGRFLHQQENIVHSGATNFTITNVANLKSGVYICCFENGVLHREIKRIVKE